MHRFLSDLIQRAYGFGVHPTVTFMRVHYLVHRCGDRSIVFTQDDIHRESARPL